MKGQTRLPKPEKHSPLPMFYAPWLRLLQRLDALSTVCGDELFLTTLSPARFLRFPRRNWPFSVLSAVNYLDFAAMVTAFFCPFTYALCRIKRKENPSCSACGHTLQDLTHLLLNCSCVRASPARHLRHHFFHF